MTILQDTRDFTNGDIVAELERLRAENARLKARSVAKLRLKISEKGALSVYGMGRWPVTLYASQWRTLLAASQDIADFLADNASALSEKGE